MFRTMEPELGEPRRRGRDAGGHVLDARRQDAGRARARHGQTDLRRQAGRKTHGLLARDERQRLRRAGGRGANAGRELAGRDALARHHASVTSSPP